MGDEMKIKKEQFEKATDNMRKVDDKPKYNEIYRLTGASNIKCIANGNTWEESKISRGEK